MTMHYAPASHIRPSLIMEIDALAKQLQSQGRDIINLSAGEPDQAAAMAAKAGMEEALKRDFSGYTASSGMPELKNQAALCMGVPVENLTVSSGAKPLIHAVLRCVIGSGDGVLLPLPCYPSFTGMIELCGGELQPVYGSGELFKVTPADLRQAIKPNSRLLLLNNPVNPTGAVYTKEELEGLLDICREQGLWLLSDEVYRDLVFEGEVFCSLRELEEPEGCVIAVHCMSKSYCMPGYRIGFASGPKRLIQSVSAFLGQTLGPPCSLSQLASLRALEAGDAFPQALCGEYARRRDYCYERLENNPYIQTQKSQGTFYLFPSVKALLAKKGLRDDVELVQRLLEDTGVVLAPGSAFLCPGYVRLAFVKPLPMLKEAMDRLLDWAR